MNIIKTYLMTHEEEIVVGLIVTVFGGILLALLLKVGSYIKNLLFPGYLSSSDEKAILLSTPEKSANICEGRERLLTEVYSTIISNTNFSSEKKHIVITG